MFTAWTNLQPAFSSIDSRSRNKITAVFVGGSATTIFNFEVQKNLTKMYIFHEKYYLLTCTTNTVTSSARTYRWASSNWTFFAGITSSIGVGSITTSTSIVVKSHNSEEIYCKWKLMQSIFTEGNQLSITQPQNSFRKFLHTALK